MAAALEIKNLRKRFGAVVASDDISLTLSPGELLAVIGPNGAGKTSLIAQLSGEVRCDHGVIVLHGQDITRISIAARARLGLGRSFQITSLFMKETLAHNLLLALNATHQGAASPFQPFAGAHLKDQCHVLLERLGLVSLADQKVGALSHGDRRLVEVGLALARSPRVLLLDEPMAGMGQDESQRMIALLQGIKAQSDGPAILLVEHDMDAVFALADSIAVLVYGRIIAQGKAQEVRANPLVREAYLGAAGTDGDHA